MTQNINKLDALDRFCDVADSELQNFERQLRAAIAYKKNSSVLGEKVMLSKVQASSEGVENMKLIVAQLPEAMKKFEALHDEIQAIHREPGVHPAIK